MSNRKLCLISPAIGEMLVKQLAHELKNFNLYMSFANYYAVEGYPKIEEYWRSRAQEEMRHHEWCFKYLTDADYKFNYTLIEENKEVFSDIITPFKLTVDREIETTNMICKIHEAALAEKDYMTAYWLLDPLLKEQVEEENTSRMALAIIEEDSDIYLRSKEILSLLK